MIFNLVMDKANYECALLVCIQVVEETWFDLAISVQIFLIFACCFHALRPKREKETHNSQMNGKLGTDFFVCAPLKHWPQAVLVCGSTAIRGHNFIGG